MFVQKVIFGFGHMNSRQSDKFRFAMMPGAELLFDYTSCDRKAKTKTGVVFIGRLFTAARTAGFTDLIGLRIIKNKANHKILLIVHLCIVLIT